MVRQGMDSFVCAFGVDPGSSWAKATFSAMAIREAPCCFSCRGESHPRCSEEGESGSPGHPSGGTVGTVPAVCCKVREARRRIGCGTVQGIQTFGRMEIKSRAPPTDCGQPASRAPSRFFIRSGTIADASSKNWAKLGMHHARNVRRGSMSTGNSITGGLRAHVRLQDRQADLRDAGRMEECERSHEVVTRDCRDNIWDFPNLQIFLLWRRMSPGTSLRVDNVSLQEQTVRRR